MKRNSQLYGAEVRIYDNGGTTVDRYTILPPRYAGKFRERNGLWLCIGSSDNPFYPQGFGMWVTADPGPHLGKRIHWRDLPPDVKRFARESFPDYTPSLAEDVARAAGFYHEDDLDAPEAVTSTRYPVKASAEASRKYDLRYDAYLSWAEACGAARLDF